MVSTNSRQLRPRSKVDGGRVRDAPGRVRPTRPQRDRCLRPQGQHHLAIVARELNLADLLVDLICLMLHDRPSPEGTHLI